MHVDDPNGVTRKPATAARICLPITLSKVLFPVWMTIKVNQQKHPGAGFPLRARFTKLWPIRLSSKLLPAFCVVLLQVPHNNRVGAANSKIYAPGATRFALAKTKLTFDQKVWMLSPHVGV
jgi:hypothetical protein